MVTGAIMFCCGIIFWIIWEILNIIDKSSRDGGLIYEAVYDKKKLLSGATEGLMASDYNSRVIRMGIDLTQYDIKEDLNVTTRKYLPENIPEDIKDVVSSDAFFDEIDKKLKEIYGENIPDNTYPNPSPVGTLIDEETIKRQIPLNREFASYLLKSYIKAMQTKKYIDLGCYNKDYGYSDGMTNIFLIDIWADMEYEAGYKPEVSMAQLRRNVLEKQSQNPNADIQIRDIYSGRTIFKLKTSGDYDRHKFINSRKIRRIKEKEKVIEYLNKKFFPTELLDTFLNLFEKGNEEELNEFINIYNIARCSHDEYMVYRRNYLSKKEFNVFTYDPWEEMREKYGYSEDISKKKEEAINRIIVSLKKKGVGVFYDDIYSPNFIYKYPKGFFEEKIPDNAEWGMCGMKYYRDENGVLHKDLERTEIITGYVGSSIPIYEPEKVRGEYRRQDLN